MTGLLLLTVAIVAACGAGSGSSVDTGPPGATGAQPGASGLAGSPSLDPATTMAPTATPTPTVTPSAAVSPMPVPVPLPAAELVMTTGSVPGTLGSYVLDGRGSDAPWLPFDSLPRVAVAATEALTVGFVDRAAIGEWSVAIAAATDTRGLKPQGIEGVALQPSGDLLSAGPLPVGRWVLSVRLFRADSRADGVTYWAVSVP